MKKFLIFLVIIVVGVSLGLTTYYFMRNDETIRIDTKEIYCNIGDVISLEDLNITVNKPHSFSKTTFNYNAGGEEVTSLINFDETKGYYTALNGGETTIVISTTNKRCPEFKISVHIGDGSTEYPYYIENQADIQKMGDVYALDANYSLISDITLTQSFQPIGYNYSTDTWVGFLGSFNGNNHTINGLNLTGTNYTNAGLFYSLNGANVSNLTINNANIVGNYAYAGVLAGKVSGTVANVLVKNSNVTNYLTNSVTGGIVGELAGSTTRLSTSSTENVNITLGVEVEEGVSPINVVAGGLVGTIDQAIVQATLANSKIVVLNATGDIAGFAGKFIIGSDTGSVFESLTLSTVSSADYASFVSTIEKTSNYNASNEQKLVHFAGNVVVTNGVTAIKNYDATLYDTFFNETNSLYLVREVNSSAELVENLLPTDYVFYAVNQSSKVLWDSSAWTIVPGAMPKLNTTNASLTSLTSQYLLKDLAQEAIGNIDDTNENNVAQFLEYLSNNSVNGLISNKKIVLETDLDLTGVDYLPYALENSIFDGNGHTITGLNISRNNVGFAGLFAYINNSSVSNLTLEGVSFNTGATQAGAIAGKAYSSSSNSSSNISNVSVTYAGNVSATITYFGGVVGLMDNGTIVNDTTVNMLSILSNANIANAGGIVGLNTSGTVKDCSVNNVILYANTNIGGIAGVNKDNISGVSGEVIKVRYSGNVNDANVGGVAGLNEGTISDANLAVNINIENQYNTTIYVGGIAGTNKKEILNSTITGEGINVESFALGKIYIGGVVANNEGLISSVNCYVTQVGTYTKDKDLYVGGIAALNSNNNSKIVKCIVTSDIYGNTVAGIVVEMDNASASVDQVYVGKFNAESKELGKNTIKGDKYVAGASYNLSRGSITNIQLSSVMYGTTNDTITSLIVLLFPDGASLKYATVDSEFDGYGTFYKDTWKDYKQVSGTFYYNIYNHDSAAGSMQNVVINTESAKANGKTYIEGEIRPTWILFTWHSDYNNSANSSFVKDVNSSDFVNAASFKGSYIIQDPKGHVKYTKTLDYNFANGTWLEGNGIRLSIVA